MKEVGTGTEGSLTLSYPKGLKQNSCKKENV
jgi:hypothetical protein